jgi:hypothetical protein
LGFDIKSPHVSSKKFFLVIGKLNFESSDPAGQLVILHWEQQMLSIKSI